MSDNERKLLALHIHKGPDGNWYVVATIESSDETPITMLVYEAPPTHRPIFVPDTGQLSWEPKQENSPP